MPLIYQKMIYREDMMANPNVFYLFGDNETRTGRGGQAKEMRGEPNAIGIRTKKKPLFDPDAYWRDDEYDRYVKLIDEDFGRAWMAMEAGSTIICPLDGLGTGMALLHINAPRTLDYIKQWLVDMAEW